MSAVRRLALLLCCLQLSLHDVGCLTNVTMFVNPPAVEQGENVILGCNYDLENVPLYSVKWYRGTREIYRYSPHDNPPTKTFTYPDLVINIDLNYSNATQVMLRKVMYTLGGNVSCEVTTDRPIKTATAYDFLEVVILPPGPPVIKVNKNRYQPGERLQGNCTYESSKPAAKLRFLINNKLISTPETRPYQLPESVYINTIAFDHDPLTPGDFVDDKLGVLEVTCTAHVGRYFKKGSSLRIGPKNGDPVPERVRSHSGGVAFCPNEYLVMVAVLLFLHHRPS